MTPTEADVSGSSRSTRTAILVALVLVASLLQASSAASAPGTTADNNYLVGAGIYDVTGLVAETPRFGYADPFTPIHWHPRSPVRTRLHRRRRRGRTSRLCIGRYRCAVPVDQPSRHCRPGG